MTVDEIRAELAKQGKIALIWSVEDVLTVRENLTTDEAMLVLVAIEHEHDASLGVNWDDLEAVADDLFPDNQERESCRCRECGEPMFIEDDGVSHHGAPDEIDHDADADHVAIADH